MRTGRTWVQFSVAPKSLYNWDGKNELARYYWKAKQRPKTCRSIPNLLAIKFSEKHILRIINYHSLLWYQITLEKQQFQLQSMQSWTQHADITYFITMKLEFERYTKLRNQISRKKGLRKGQVSRDTQERKRGTVVRFTVHTAARL